jgi:hypothetical protein
MVANDVGSRQNEVEVNGRLTSCGAEVILFNVGAVDNYGRIEGGTAARGS